MCACKPPSAKWGGRQTPYVVDFESVTTQGPETSPAASGLAGLRANEARYYMNKYNHAFTTVPAQTDGRRTLDFVSRVLLEERGIALSAKPLGTSMFELENTRIAYVFYEDRLVVNVMYPLDNPKQRAVGLKLSEGMDVPAALEGKFKFARQKSRLAGTIRGSLFIIKGEYAP